jgi:hypothetical protein
MKRAVLVAGTVAAFAAAAAGPAWAQAKPWLHVRVEEPRKETKVHVNLPLSVVEAVLAAAPQKLVSRGRIHLHDHDLSVADIRRAWNELKDAGDAEIVSIQERDQTVSVRREGRFFRVRVDKPSEKEAVNVDLPVSLVDALLSGEGRELNVREALAELQKLRGDIVRVTDRDSTVRVWIDEKN